VTIVATDTLRASADTERSTASASYVKLKEFIVAATGIIRVKFDLKLTGTGGANTARGRIYKNDAAVGTERSDTGGTYQTFTEDITVSGGDVIQLYAYHDGGTSGEVRNYRIYGDFVGDDVEVVTD